mmetsp:Transcript_11026/g.25680  ORF Transcript_11026/g.25680 Transcript_11026/m.25680 type:complete len:92 (+) Transcript_11026:2057-2332(+)
MPCRVLGYDFVRKLETECHGVAILQSIQTLYYEAFPFRARYSRTVPTVFVEMASTGPPLLVLLVEQRYYLQLVISINPKEMLCAAKYLHDV